MDLDEDQVLAVLVAYLRMDRLDDGALAGAARTPEQGVVGRQAAGEAQGVVEQDLFLPVDAEQQFRLDAADVRYRFQPVEVGAPDEGLGGVPVDFGALRRGETLQGVGDTVERGGDAVEFHDVRAYSRWERGKLPTGGAMVNLPRECRVSAPDSV